MNSKTIELTNVIPSNLSNLLATLKATIYRFWAVVCVCFKALLWGGVGYGIYLGVLVSIRTAEMGVEGVERWHERHCHAYMARRFKEVDVTADQKHRNIVIGNASEADLKAAIYYLLGEREKAIQAVVQAAADLHDRAEDVSGVR